MAFRHQYVELVANEIVRKLRLASDADTPEDREIVCEEVFCDVTGLLDDAARVGGGRGRLRAGGGRARTRTLTAQRSMRAAAQAQLGVPKGCPFYLVLAHYYASPRGADAAVAVMHLLQVCACARARRCTLRPPTQPQAPTPRCTAPTAVSPAPPPTTQSVYGQGYAAPLVALLLHRWLLLRRWGAPRMHATHVQRALLHVRSLGAPLASAHAVRVRTHANASTHARTRRAPGRGVPEEQRVRLANVMALGARQLFEGDIQSGAHAFRPMWRALCYEVRTPLGPCCARV